MMTYGTTIAEIRGMAALIKHTKITESILRRHFKLDGFPQPLRLDGQGSHRLKVWSEAQVNAWLAQRSTPVISVIT